MVTSHLSKNIRKDPTIITPGGESKKNQKYKTYTHEKLSMNKKRDKALLKLTSFFVWGLVDTKFETDLDQA
jgi:hypothetical protein